MNPFLVRGAVAVAAALLLGSCSESAGPPAAPSPPTLTITPAPTPKLAALSIIGTPLNLQIGASSQLRVVSRAEDGSFQDVTALAAWQSSNVNICAVTAAGLVEGRGAGTATLTVSYGGLTEQATLTCGYVISALIHENAPTTSVTIAGARVDVVGGPLDGRTFESDAAGRVTLPPVAQPGFALYFKHRHYDDRRLEIFELPRQTNLDVSLLPAPVRALTPSGVCLHPSIYVAFVQHRFSTTRESRVRATANPGTTFENLCAVLYREGGPFGTIRVFSLCGSKETVGEAVVPPGNYYFSYAPVTWCPIDTRWGFVLEHTP